MKRKLSIGLSQYFTETFSKLYNNIPENFLHRIFSASRIEYFDDSPKKQKKHNNYELEEGKDENEESKYDSEKISKNYAPISKHKLIRVLETILHTTLSKKTLVDITFYDDEIGAEVAIVGRPAIAGLGKKQMRHIIPYSFVKKMVITIIEENAQSPKDIFDALLETIVVFCHDQKGLAVPLEDLRNREDYEDILENLPSLTQKIMESDGEEIALLSPKKSSQFTARSREKYTKKFANQNIKYIKAAIAIVSQLMENSHDDTTTKACEILTRFIFTIFNQTPNCSFPKEINTSTNEIRLYKTKEDLANCTFEYEVMSAREIKALKDDDIENVTGLIRLVKSEGSQIKEIPKGLNLINQIIQDHIETTLDRKTIENFNENYNYTLKLANSDELDSNSEYNEELTLDNYKQILPFQIAKLLYLVFDLKALEAHVLTPSIKGDIILYPSAKEDGEAKYSINDGNEYREEQKNKAHGYSKNQIFRTKELDLEILPEKLAKLFFIGTFPFKALQYGFDKTINLPKIILEKLSTLAIMDHEIENQEEFCTSLTKFYETLTPVDLDDRIEPINLFGLFGCEDEESN